MRCPCARQRQERDHPPYRVMADFKPLPKLDRLKELFDYNPDTGLFTRTTAKGNGAKGKVAGCRTRRGYVKLCVDRTAHLAHRLAWLYVTGDDPTQWVIDHANGDPFDNRFCNLRICTNSQNNQNSMKQSNNSSGFKGVYLDTTRNQWRATITTKGVFKHLGRFKTAEEAFDAYCKAAAELHGEFARCA